jgi:tRNA-uridine 2-sulfurtransferase
MQREALESYLADASRRRPAGPDDFSGAAGGAACGDLVRISFALRAGRLERASCAAEGCAASRAAAAATAELIDGAELREAALLDAAAIERELGGLSALGRHGAELAADALHRALGEAALSGAPLLDAPAPGEPPRVLVAMSGGVDSAVAALREREAGNDVLAVTLELWSDPANDGEASCCSPQAVRAARGLSHSLGIPHLTVDLRERFRAGVVDPFLAGYAAGETPNPCVRCNGQVRIEPMIGVAERLGAEGLATGHYARIDDDGDGPLLAAAADPGKDQTYMLAALPTRSLARMRFPLAGLRKPEVRELAAAAGLPVAAKAESQDLCFLAGEGKRGFLRRHGGLGPRRGEIVDRDGAVLGSHRGHHEFTVGQRRGVGVAAPEPLYVLATDAAANRVTVGTREQLLDDRVAVEDLVLHRPAEQVGAVKLRYRARPAACELIAGAAGEAEIRLAEPLARPAPGQIAVLLDGERIVGHGRICVREVRR